MSARACVICGDALHRRLGERPHRFADRRTCGKTACRSRLGWLTREGTAEQRFWARVRKAPNETDCWVWVGAIDKDGYGRLGRQLAHHVSLKIAGRDVPPAGMDTDHLCRNRACVNPDHLEIVTRRENALRGENIQVLRHRSGQCKWGHPYSEHAYFHKGKVAYCKTCRDRRRQEARARA